MVLKKLRYHCKVFNGLTSIAEVHGINLNAINVQQYIVLSRVRGSIVSNP